ncbi:hypothetical protein E4L96_05585, partial [Massilia arenosa]
MPPALGPRGRLALGAACVVYCAAVALLLPSAAVATHRVPQASALYAITILIVHGLTALLLGFQYRGGGGRAVRILVAAYAYSALHALLHTLTYPGALVPDIPLLGHGQTVGWLFLAWQLGFTLLLTSAIGVELFGGAAQERSAAPRGRLRPVLALVCAVAAATYMAAEVLPLPVYFQGDRFYWFANATTAATAVGVAVGLAMLAALPRARSALYPWLALALLATLGGLVLSTTGGGRYTVGWYAARVSYTVGGAAVLALLLAQIARMQQSLMHSVASLAQQTQSLQAEMQKREAAEMMLVQSQKMEVVGRLAGGIAHDFNNFLHVVSMRLDLLQHRLRGQDLDEDLAIIRRGVRRVEALIQHLLSFSGRKRFQPEVIVLDRWLPECMAFIQATLGARVQVRHSLERQALAVTGNPSELEAAVLNLVLNARDALEDQGEIHVRASLRTLAPGHHPELPPGVYVELTVADNGSGIAPEHLARVFDPFFTTKPVGKGSGLGLPQVRGFAIRQGGTVDIDSALGQGTTVRLLLPAAGGAAGAS